MCNYIYMYVNTGRTGTTLNVLLFNKKYQDKSFSPHCFRETRVALLSAEWGTTTCWPVSCPGESPAASMTDPCLLSSPRSPTTCPGLSPPSTQNSEPTSRGWTNCLTFVTLRIDNGDLGVDSLEFTLLSISP